jgi:hypothetical protein
MHHMLVIMSCPVHCAFLNAEGFLWMIVVFMQFVVPLQFSHCELLVLLCAACPLLPEAQAAMLGSIHRGLS